jgi:hypothetical protein
MDEQPRTAIEVKVGFFPLGFFLFFFPPTIVIDDVPHQKYWGTHQFEVEPGRHTVRIFIKYFLVVEAGDSSTEVTVEKGSIARLKYYMPPWMGAKPPIEQV